MGEVKRPIRPTYEVRRIIYRCLPKLIHPCRDVQDTFIDVDSSTEMVAISML